MPADPPVLLLVPLGETDAEPYSIPQDRPISIGRSASSDLCILDDGVSRRHAVVRPQAERLLIVDQGSTGGTYVNGVRLEESVPIEIEAGDLLRLGPTSFRVTDSCPSVRVAKTVDDSETRGQRVDQPLSAAPSSSNQRLKLLTACIAGLNGASDETTLADAALSAVLAGSGFARAAVLRKIDGGHEIELLASDRAEHADDESFVFSRSLVSEAAHGTVAVLSQEGRSIEYGQSIAELNIHSALCAPYYLGGSIEGYLYLDARGQEASVQPDAAGFCEAVATAYGLALANIKRADLQRRQQMLQSDLDSAREVQQRMLPPPSADLGVMAYAVRMVPGLFVAGDLFDLLELPDNRTAICLGDVTGHGIGSGIIMAMTQSHLHAQLRAGADPASAVRAVNDYMAERITEGRFISLWLGILSPDGAIDFVDAGHGHVLTAAPTGQPIRLTARGGLPVGIDAAHEYKTEQFSLAPGERLTVFSDGLIEQRNAQREEFGIDRLAAAIATRSPEEAVRSAFQAVEAFAGTPVLDDDATIASIEYRG